MFSLANVIMQASVIVMRMRIVPIIFGIAAIAPASGHALTAGNYLLEKCSTRKSDENYAFNFGICLGYVIAAADAELLSGSNSLCIPQGAVTKGQLKDVVLLYLRNNPNKRHFAAVGLATAALAEAFPCADGGRKQ